MLIVGSCAPKNFLRTVHRLEVNFAPLSEVISDGTPNCKMMGKEGLAHEVAVALKIGMAIMCIS